MIIDPILGDLPRSTNDDFNVSPTSYEISTEDLVVSYTATKTVTRALAFANGKWIYCTSFTDKTITFSNADFVVGENSITVMDVNYSDGTYGRFTGVVTVTKNEEAPAPPPVVDNVPVVSQNIPNQAGILGDMFTITYTASDDKGISKHELYSGSSYIVKTPVSDGNNHSITFRPTVAGVKNCKIRITDTKGQTVLSNVFTITVSDPVINEPPTLIVNSTDSNYNGEYSINYTISDPNKDKMTVSLVVEGGNPITVSTNAVNGTYTYRGSGLDAGVHSIVLKVSDGENLVSENLTVSIPQRPIVQASLLGLYQKDGSTKIGDLDDAFSAYVTEERNGIFELEINYPNEFPYADQIINENFITCKPNDKQEVQKFRIYSVKQLMKNTLTVRARHESYDIATDHIEKLDLKNASCEYVLNELFRNSFFSTDFRGFSDIVNAQDYYIENTNLLNAIAGKEGSIIDTFGTGAEIYRNNKEIHVLNRRGHDNDVTIEFGKNLTDFVLEVDLTGLETRVGGFAKYRDSEGNEVTIKSDWVDSPFIENFAHPYVNTAGRRDYSAHFDNENKPTKEKLNLLCADEFKINKRDLPKNKYTLKFIPLSKCVGYEATQDAISLCDTVRVIDPRFRLDSKVKVIKYTYDVLKQRYESMELGDPRTTLGNIIGGSSKPPALTEEDVKDIINNSPGKDFPNTLPATPVVTANVRGIASIELSWTFDNKPYYQYELYASREKGFAPNTFDLIHKGQSSSFVLEAKPAETWYFRVCGTNSYNERTAFSEEVEVNTVKVESLDAYFSEIGIGSAVAGAISAGYVEANSIKGNWIDARHLTVTDGNGKRTLDIDSFGRVTIDSDNIKSRGQEVASVPYVSTQIENIKLGGKNYLRNSNFKNGIDFHSIENPNGSGSITFTTFDNRTCCKFDNIGYWRTSKYLKVAPTPYDVNNGYIIGLDIFSASQCTIVIDLTGPLVAEDKEIQITAVNRWVRYYIKIPAHAGSNVSGDVRFSIYAKEGNTFKGYITDIMVEHGTKEGGYQQAYEDLESKVVNMATEIKSFEEQITPDALKRTFSKEFYTKEGANAEFTSKTEFEQNNREFLLKIEQTGRPQLIPNGALREGTKFWSAWQAQSTVELFGGYKWFTVTPQFELGTQSFGILMPEMEVQAGKTYTVGAWVSGDITSLNYNFLMQLKNGAMEGVQKINSISIGDVSKQAKRVSVTFTALTTGFVQPMFGYEGVMNANLKIRLSEACCFEGYFLYPYQEANNTIYTSNAYFDITGMGMKHKDGSISRITHESFELTDIYERLKMAIKKGTLYAYDVDNGNLLGMFGSNRLNTNYKGVTTGIAGNSHYYAIGVSYELTDTSNLSMKPYMLIAQQDLRNVFGQSYISAGINFMNTPAIFHEPVYCKRFFEGGGLYSPNSILSLGYTDETANYQTAFAVEGGIKRLKGYMPLDMNGWQIYNASLGYSVVNRNSPVTFKSLKGVEPKGSVFDEIEVVNPSARIFKASRVVDSIGELDVTNVTNKDEIMLNEDSADLGKLVTILFKEVKELKEEIKRLKELK